MDKHCFIYYYAILTPSSLCNVLCVNKMFYEYICIYIHTPKFMFEFMCFIKPPDQISSFPPKYEITYLLTPDIICYLRKLFYY